MRQFWRGASRHAMLAGLAAFGAGLGGQAAYAQQVDQIAGPQQAGQEGAPASTDRVVVIGSLLAGAAEDAPSPVEVFTAEDLAEQGSPNIVEFTRGLAISSEAFGAPDINLASTASGFSNVNLRGLGAARTMTLLNGHRTSVDTSFLPMNAIGRVEILKDGAGVTYGAGAVAGVINFVTRDNFDGVELSAQHKIIDGSDGETELSALVGFNGDRGNILLSAMYAHQSPLNFTARDFGQLPWDVNPTQYVEFAANPGTFHYNGGTTTLRDYDTASCAAVGGVQPNNSATCYYYYTPFYNFIDEQTNVRLFASGDFDVSDTMEFHAEIGYSKTDVPEVWAAPTQPPTPESRGIGGTASGTSLGICAFSGYYCMFEVPVVNAGVRNPYIDLFYDQLRARYGATVAGAANPATGRLLTGLFWEPFGYGGNPVSGGKTRVESRMSERWGGNVRLKGEFAEDSALGFLNGVNYDYALTAGMTTTVNNRRDIIVSRVQDALRGYGGPNCGAVDEVPTVYAPLPRPQDYPATPAGTAAYNAALAAARLQYDQTIGIQSSTVAPGTGGCEWLNPFASAWSASEVNGAANPSYGGAAYENSLGLIQWLHGEKPFETQTIDLNLDILYSGQIPWFELPGGAIGWAAGGQWRQEEVRVSSNADGVDGELNEQNCVWPDPGSPTSTPQQPPVTGQLGCIGNPGPYWGTGYLIPSYSDRQVVSLFGEVQLPVLDNLDLQLALRHEDYGSLSADTYKVAGKWQATDSLAFRASYSTNYAPPPTDLGAGGPTTGSAYIATYTAFFPTLITPTPGLKPEEAVVKNIGVLFENDAPGENGYFSASLDYFDFDITEQIVTTSVNTILTAVGTGTVQGLNRLVNCSAPHAVFLEFNTGGCIQDTSTIGSISRVLTYQVNGPSIATAGFDLSMNYSADIGPGEFRAGLNATKVTKYEVGGYTVQGVQFDLGGDRLGFSNASRTGDFSSELRGSLFTSYGFGPHSFRAQANYTQGVTDERGVPAAAPSSEFGIFPEDYWDLDLHYRLDVPWVEDMEFRASLLNVTDEDPMRYQTRNSYYTGVGNPRGRHLELSVTKRF